MQTLQEIIICVPGDEKQGVTQVPGIRPDPSFRELCAAWTWQIAVAPVELHSWILRVGLLLFRDFASAEARHGAISQQY